MIYMMPMVDNMARNKKILSASEILDICSKQWATLQDIKSLASVGNNKAIQIRKDIKATYDENKKLFNELIPMSDVIKYIDLDIEYLKKVSKR